MTTPIPLLWRDGYELGYMHGIDAGRQQADDEWRGRQEISVAIARMISQSTPYADLCDRRGEHDRARAQRTLLRDRGVSAA